MLAFWLVMLYYQGSSLKGCTFPLGFETHRGSTRQCLNDFYSPFGIETYFLGYALLTSLCRNDLCSPLGFETFLHDRCDTALP